MEYKPGIKAQEKIEQFTESAMRDFPRQLGIPEIIPGCEVTNLDPYSEGLATFPRSIKVRISNYTVDAQWRGSPVLAVGDECEVIHLREGDLYIVVAVSGTKIISEADILQYHWVYDVSENLLLPYDTINGALGYAALASGDYVMIKPGIFDVSITLVDGVIITEQIPGTVILHSTSADTCVTLADGGYLQCKEIKCTRGAGSTPVAVDASGLGAGETCEIRAELIQATQSNSTGAEGVSTILGGGAGTLSVYANLIKADYTGNGGGGAPVRSIYINGDTFHIFSDLEIAHTGTDIADTYCVYTEAGTLYIKGDIDGSGDDWLDGIFLDGGTVYMWGDINIVTDLANSRAVGIEEFSLSTCIVYGNVSAVAEYEALGMWPYEGVIEVYGNVYAENTDAGASGAIGCDSDGGVVRVHGDITGTGLGGDRYGVRCDGDTTTITCGRASGDTTDLVQTGGTLQVFMVEYDTYSGTITSYYPLPDDGWIGIAGGTGARINYDTTPTPDVINHANCDVGINEPSPDRKWHATVSDAVTAAISYVKRITHETSGVAAALLGVGEEHELEDAAGNNQVASEDITLWAVATSGSESPLRRWTTYPTGSAGPGYLGLWTWDGLDDTARTVIPNGTGDVTAVLTVQYSISESGGGTSGGTAVVDNSSSVDLYDDGTDVFTLTVNADGSVEVARSAGASTCDIILQMTWI